MKDKIIPIIYVGIIPIIVITAYASKLVLTAYFSILAVTSVILSLMGE